MRNILLRLGSGSRVSLQAACSSHEATGHFDRTFPGLVDWWVDRLMQGWLAGWQAGWMWGWRGKGPWMEGGRDVSTGWLMD